MDYYEELGLPPTATVQEIRHAYKMLARLLHPDGQTDDRVRALAQRQMQRLNEILATLTHEQTRREYDSRMAVLLPRNADAVVLDPTTYAGATPPILRNWVGGPEPWLTRLPEWAQWGIHHWFWISLVVAAASVLIWSSMQPGSPPEPPAVTSPATAEPPKTALPRHPEVRRSAVMANTRRSPVTSPMEEGNRSADLPGDAGMAATDQRAIEVPVEPPGSVRVQAPTDSRGDEKPEAPLQTPRSTGFAGTWLYVADPAEEPETGTYPPVYVELSIAEAHGGLGGHYRARYKVSNRAVSPEVTFRVQGELASGPTAHLTWNSTHGAKGVMEIALERPNVMNVSWWSTQLGRQPALASGRAILVREVQH